MKNRTRWILVAIMAVILVFIGVYQYYIYVQKDTWKAEDAAILRAKKEAGLVQTTEVTKSVWDTVCWVVEGKNADGEDIMVWLDGDSAPHIELKSNGLSKQAMTNKVKSELPDARIVRLLPGVYEGQYVWQLFYKADDHYYYRFYRFSNGQPLSEQFTVPNR
ncbi:hypothetical protein DCC85_12590 [Paenibacillus sp. CAA11]|uniref:cell wall elongation regulator TseB-like domain-containing protein n=1 Tax=Paenibacillus sp. CAA11 TaxID=1532905 RepID=UPI000D33F37C|nr:DUF5590 domain-containing protein [Paenibacillus sp. CAA11]AWB44974.1 hypothetical protein DCC85_12590 [Paenibacillus sp. CAA11]